MSGKTKVDKEDIKNLYTGNNTQIVLDGGETKLLSELATSAQGGKADTAIQGVKKNGTLVTPDEGVVDVAVPTKTSEITNDSNFLTAITKDLVEAVLTGTITSHEHDYSTDYLGITDKAADSEKLDGLDSTDFATAIQGGKADTAIQGVKVNDVDITPDSDNKVNVAVPTTVAELSDSNEYAHLDNGKILEGNLPDYIFGQVLFGGFVSYDSLTNTLFCTLSAKFKSKYNILENTLILENMPAANYEGVYFMASNVFTTNLNFQVGDWLISNGSTWSKIDNTDAVTSVNGQTGAINITTSSIGAASVSHNHIYSSLIGLPIIADMKEEVASNTSLENITTLGIYPLFYGRRYYKAPNPICGTVEERTDLGGFLFVHVEGDLISQILHDTINNILYIRGFDILEEKFTLWKRLLTCVDEIATEPEEVNPYEYLIDNTNQHIYIDEEFDVKEDTIVIDLTNYSSYIGIKINIGIHFSPDTGSPVNVSIIDNNNKLIKVGSSNVYTNPSDQSISNIYWIQYEIWNFQPYWLVGNRIYS